MLRSTVWWQTKNQKRQQEKIRGGAFPFTMLLPIPLQAASALL